MSDISIPGVSSKYNTDKLIDTIMQAERIPLERMEDRKEDFSSQKKIWNDVNRRISTLQDNSRDLYSFENPFRDYVANSPDESILTATADRNASRGIQQVKVSQVAAADSFRSRSLPEDYKIPAGEYGFTMGEQEITFSYRGGDIDDFVRKLNSRGKGLIEAQTVKDTPDTRMLVIKATKTGRENRLGFVQDSMELGVNTGILTRVRTGEREIDLSAENVSTLKKYPLQGDIEFAAEGVKVPARSAASIEIAPSIAAEGPFILEVKVKIENLSEKDFVPPSPPPGPDVPGAGGVELEGIEVLNAPNVIETPPWEPPPKPQRVDALDVLQANGSQKLPALQDTDEVQTFRIPMTDFNTDLTSIEVLNTNTHRNVSVLSVQLLNPEARGDFEPQFPVSKAQDAVLEVNGIPVQRETNEIEDVIPGLTLQPRRASDRVLELQVEPDREGIKNALIKFLGSYNRLITEINILTSREESVVEEIGYFEEDEREAALERLGIFMGDTTFMQMKNRLQRIMSSPYTTSAGRELSMLSQMGISTNVSGSGGVNRSKLRGYLEVDESRLDEAIDSNIEAMGELFGRDSTGDMIIDSGLAKELHSFLQMYTQTGGLIDTRIAGIDRQIADTDEDITDLKRQLEDKEVDLKRQYGRMESALGQLEETSRSIENFNTQNSD